MVYRAIRPLAGFHDDYRAIDEIILNSKTSEASSHLNFGSVKRGGNFHTHPAIIDSLTQSCGFTMNCKDSTDLDIKVYKRERWCLKKESASTQCFPMALEMQNGDGLVLDVKKSLEHSKSLPAVGPVSGEVVRKYIHIWKEIGVWN